MSEFTEVEVAEVTGKAFDWATGCRGREEDGGAQGHRPG